MLSQLGGMLSTGILGGSLGYICALIAGADGEAALTIGLGSGLVCAYFTGREPDNDW